jgi:hypothetical protein
MRARSSGIVVVAGAVAAIALGGCRATTYGEAEPVGYVELTAAPVDVTLYPHTYYDGRDVYWVNDRWMYRDRGRWLYYRNEPPALYRQRPYVQQAPPAYPRSYPYPQSYPQSYPRPAPGPYRVPAQPVPDTAPPATRVQ